MSGDIKIPKAGEEAPEPDDGVYRIAGVDEANKQYLLRWEAKGMTFECWVPESQVEALVKH